jgi:hypothetical protein
MDLIVLIQIFFILMIGHAIADFALQSDVMAKLKNRHNEQEAALKTKFGKKYVPCWGWWLSAHGLIHAGMVLVITQNVWLAMIEFVLHTSIDFVKCEGKTNPNVDQLLHIICKFSYALYLA